VLRVRCLLRRLRPSAAVLTPEQQEFQEYARRWLAENAPPPAPERLPITAIEVMTVRQRDYLQAWQRKCYDAGLVGADYPTEYGGGGHQGFQAIANRELGRAQVPFLINIVGAILCGLGLLVTWPLTIVAGAYVYKSLKGEPVAA